MKRQRLPDPPASQAERGFPVLLTERLRLRAPDLGDSAAFHDLLLLPEVTRFSNWPDKPTRPQTERALRRMSDAYGKKNGCAWMIEDRMSGSLLGAVRFSIDRPWKWAEVGYEIHPSVWGKGLMTEALTAVTQCGFDHFSLNRIEAWTLPDNAASQRVLEKSGFRYEGTLHQKAWFKDAFYDLRIFACLANTSAASS